MRTKSVTPGADGGGGLSAEGSARDHLDHLLEHLAHLLPAQGPIGVFIHHNTLHAFQHLPFEEAVMEAHREFRAAPYLAEARFREAMASGRIRAEDIDAVLEREPDAEIVPGLRRRALWRAMLLAGTREFDAAGIRWRLEEGDLARELAAPAARTLFDACLRRTGEPEAPRRIAERPLDELIHPLLIRLASVYLDQGMSYWPMPCREEGFYRAVRRLLAQPAGLFPRELAGLDTEFRSHQAAGASAASVVVGFLGPDQNSWEPRLRDELLALPGWTGLFSRLEKEPELFPHVGVPCTLLDFLAVRLTMAKVAAANAAAAPAPAGARDREAARLARAAALYEAARLAGLNALAIHGWTGKRWARFVVEAESFGGLERRRVYHLAYERRHEQEVLHGLASHRRTFEPPPRCLRPSAQVFFCLDEREESIRRALEEADPLVETFGAAGFYGVAVDYKGIDDARGAALCPVVVKPKHAVRELPAGDDAALHETRVFRRRLWARLSRNLFVSSRSLVRGALSTVVLGTLTAIPLIARTLAPLRYAKLRDALNRAFFPEPRTELTLMRDDARSHDAVEGLLLGFGIEEKADRVASVLGPAGLTERFARLVAILGHGSTSLNNPYESAYNCGACGGRAGGPNARLFAAMANRPEVRRVLRTRGISIPDDTWFVGGFHDTCSDDVVFLDTGEIPPGHRNDFAALRHFLDKARAKNAHERTRRFASFSQEKSPARALRHVQERSEHLAQPRPEYGHCTNAVCIVGRREITRGLFLDRRAFLASYDAAADPEDRNLAALLAAAIPVCAGINLEYYFSCVDNARYGAGTKLPHNITGLLGVMNGHASDLLTGLVLQMVEIHEPVRCLFVIETTPERLERVISGDPAVREFVVNRWIRLAAMDPESGRIRVRRDGVYEELEGEAAPLPAVGASIEWYRGKSGHLPPAAIAPAEFAGSSR